MNDQVLPKPEGASQKIGAVNRLSLLIRTLLLAAVVVAGIAFALHYFQTTKVDSVSLPEEESIQILESEPTPEEEVEVPLSSITSCINQQMIDEAEHPLAPLIDMGVYGQEVIESTVIDYTATLTKRLRIKGKLQPEEKMLIKIRHPIESEKPGESVPFSIYTRFLDPKKGQEAIWVEGRNENKLVAHGPVGILNLMTLNLDPQGKMAMNGNRYPIWDAGMLNLIKLMTKKARNDIQFDDCRVELRRNVMLRDDAKCTCFVIVHEQEAKHFEYHRVEIYIDDERNLPIGFRSFSWPTSAGGKPRLEELYYYTDVKINVGLTDADFDPANEAYDFPGK